MKLIIFHQWIKKKIGYPRLLFSFPHPRLANMSLSSLIACICLYIHIGYESNLCPHIYSVEDNLFDHKK